MKAEVVLGGERFEKKVYLRELDFVSYLRPIYMLSYEDGAEYPLYLPLCGSILLCKEANVYGGGVFVFHGLRPVGIRYSVRKGIELQYFDPGLKVDPRLNLGFWGIKGIRFYFEDVVEFLARIKGFFQKHSPEWYLDVQGLSLSFYFHSKGLSVVYGRYYFDFTLEECNRVYYWTSLGLSTPLKLSSLTLGAMTDEGFQKVVLLKDGDVFDKPEFYSYLIGACRVRSYG
ncbi:MAG: hypothetical protein QW067_02995 [Thermofilaceae archaeon]